MLLGINVSGAFRSVEELHTFFKFSEPCHRVETVYRRDYSLSVLKVERSLRLI